MNGFFRFGSNLDYSAVKGSLFEEGLAGALLGVSRYMDVSAFAVLLLLFISMLFVIAGPYLGRKIELWGHIKTGIIMAVILLCWSIVSLSGVTQFLYFNF